VPEPPEVLADAVEDVLAGWVERSVARIVVAYRGSEPTDVVAAARDAGAVAVAEVGPALRTLLAEDVDEQRTSPLALVRQAVRYPTGVLRAAGVPEVVRDEFRERAFPDDVYDLSPATWQDIDPALHEPGLIWGAWKAKTVLDRRREEGRR
jgi:hypothetical protein